MHLLSSWWWVMDGFHRQQSRRTVYRVAPVGSVDNSLSFIRGQEPTHQNSRRTVKTLNWLLVTSMHFQSTATKQILPLLWENFVQTLCPICSDCIHRILTLDKLCRTDFRSDNNSRAAKATKFTDLILLRNGTPQ